MLRLDEKDIRLLEIMTKDGRESLTNLAEAIGASIPTARARLEKLQKFGIISQIVAFVNPNVLSNHFSLIASFNIEDTERESVLMTLQEDNDIKELYEALGDRAIVLRSHLLSARELRRVILRIQELRGVFSMKTLLLTETLKENPHRVPKENIEFHLNCEYCGKEIVSEEEFHTIQLKSSPHFFCCTICKRSYLSWREKQIAQRLKPKSQIEHSKNDLS